MQKPLQLFTLAAALTFIAAVPRFLDLGFLSFYGDEQLTAMVSRSIAEGHGAHMPSGMPYLRGLPLSYMTAASSEILGPEEEFAYRLPAALLGTLTIPAFFLLAQGFVRRAAAFVAALLLALADWHIVISREARMYAPFVLCVMVAGFVAWYAAKDPRHHRWLLAITALAFCTGVALHQLGIFAVLILPLPLAFIGWTRISTVILIALPAVGFAAAQYYNRIVSSNFKRWGATQGIGRMPSEDGATSPAAFDVGVPSILGSVLGLALGLWSAHVSTYEDDAPGAILRRLAHYGLGAVTGALAGSGMLHAAGLAGLTFFVMHRQGGLALSRKARVPLTGILIVALVQLCSATFRLGVLPGLKSAMAFPFPYLAHLGPLFPGVVLVFSATCIWVALRPQGETGYPVRAGILAALLPLAAIGALREWGEIRYLMMAFPFLLLVTAVGLVESLEWLGHRSRHWSTRGAVAAATIISCSGALGGHGLPQAWRQATAVHGSAQAYRVPYFFPDHQAPGEYVRAHRRPGDIVVTENALRQRWYVGHIDYWLRSPSGSPEVFRAPDGTTRDAYLNLVIPETDVLTRLDRSTDRIWYITSAEHWDDYFSSEQEHWLRRVQEHEPVFAGRDGATKVYCLNCDGGD